MSATIQDLGAICLRYKSITQGANPCKKTNNLIRSKPAKLRLMYILLTYLDDYEIC